MKPEIDFLIEAAGSRLESILIATDDPHRFESRKAFRAALRKLLSSRSIPESAISGLFTGTRPLQSDWERAIRSLVLEKFYGRREESLVRDLTELEECLFVLSGPRYARNSSAEELFADSLEGCASITIITNDYDTTLRGEAVHPLDEYLDTFLGWSYDLADERLAAEMVRPSALDLSRFRPMAWQYQPTVYLLAPSRHELAGWLAKAAYRAIGRRPAFQKLPLSNVNDNLFCTFLARALLAVNGNGNLNLVVIDRGFSWLPTIHLARGHRKISFSYQLDSGRLVMGNLLDEFSKLIHTYCIAPAISIYPQVDMRQIIDDCLELLRDEIVIAASGESAVFRPWHEY